MNSLNPIYLPSNLLVKPRVGTIRLPEDTCLPIYYIYLSSRLRDRFEDRSIRIISIPETSVLTISSICTVQHCANSVYLVSNHSSKMPASTLGPASASMPLTTNPDQALGMRRGSKSPPSSRSAARAAAADPASTFNAPSSYIDDKTLTRKKGDLEADAQSVSSRMTDRSDATLIPGTAGKDKQSLKEKIWGKNRESSKDSSMKPSGIQYVKFQS